MKKFILIFLSLSLLAAGFVYAQGPAGPKGAVQTIVLPEIKTELKPGEGVETTEGYCSVCHSLDYITMQPKASKAQWTATVNKMIKAMGAPIPENDAKVIINYLTASYGSGK